MLEKQPNGESIIGSSAITNQYSLQLNAHLHTSFHPSPDGRSDRIRIGHSILMRFIKVQNSVSWIALPSSNDILSYAAVSSDDRVRGYSLRLGFIRATKTNFYNK